MVQHADIDHSGLTGVGGGAAGPEVERVYLQSLTSGTTHNVTIAAVASGKRIVLVVQSYNRDVNTPTCTNVTFTQVASHAFGTSSYISVYVGVATGTSGTTIAVTATGSDWIITDTYIIGDALTPTAGASATLDNTDAAATALVPIGPLAATPGDFFVVAVGQSNGTTSINPLDCSSPIVKAPNGGANVALVSGVGRAQADVLTAWYRGGSSGGDMAAVIGIVS